MTQTGFSGIFNLEHAIRDSMAHIAAVKKPLVRLPEYDDVDRAIALSCSSCGLPVIKLDPDDFELLARLYTNDIATPDDLRSLIRAYLEASVIAHSTLRNTRAWLKNRAS